MVTSTDLFDLIKTLTKSEKAYFKKHASVFIRKGGNKYVHLFNAIAGQEQYDEKKITDQFRKEKFVKQFSVAKNYLYNRILDTMQSYHTSLLSEVHGLMNRGEYLFEKGLYRQAGKMLRMAEKLAKKHDLHSVLITIREHQQFNHSIKKREPRSAEKNIAHSEQEVHLLNNHLSYLKLLAQTQYVYNLYGRTKNKKYLHTFKKIMQHPLMQHDSRALTFNGKRRFFDIHAVYNSVIENREKAYHFSKKIISLFDENPGKKKHAALTYAGYINNTLLFCHYLRKYREMDGYLKKLKDLEPDMRTKYQQARFFEIYTNNFLNLYNTTGRYAEAGKLLPACIKGLAVHQKKLAGLDKLLIFGNIANTFFGLREYRNCLAWINRIRNELPVTLRPDLESEIRLMNIIVHSELGNRDLIPHLVVSYYRFLRKKSLLTKPEKQMLVFLKKLSGADTETKLIREMTVLRNRIEAYSERAVDTSSYAQFFFDLVSWLESKTGKGPFAEIVHEKAKKYL